jgi:hypothetical protein
MIIKCKFEMIFNERRRQGDQIGRIFANWALQKNTEIAQTLGLLFPTDKAMYWIATKTVWATLWAIFVTSSSGHPGRRRE